ncbi:MAG: hypothetical protein CFE37_01210 [Alphaproteobacteria bacterium PA4]|nr:MAG: hypothetical protein CFE37_01210 [Alphaproteobacteria bacterium PA4]
MSDLETTPDGRVVETRRPGGGGWLLAIIVIVGLVVAAFAFGFINIDQVREGKAPTVRLETSGGQAPKFDIDTARIAIGKKEETVKVPTVDVGSKDTSVTVPTVTMERADDPNKKDK